MNESEVPEEDCLEPFLFSDQKSLSLSEFIVLLGQYKRAIYEQYYFDIDQMT